MSGEHNLGGTPPVPHPDPLTQHNPTPLSDPSVAHTVTTSEGVDTLHSPNASHVDDPALDASTKEEADRRGTIQFLMRELNVVAQAAWGMNYPEAIRNRGNTDAQRDSLRARYHRATVLAS